MSTILNIPNISDLELNQGIKGNDRLYCVCHCSLAGQVSQSKAAIQIKFLLCF